MRRANVVGALLISSQIKSQLFAMNKGGQWGNQPPPQGPDGQRSELPLTPPALALSDRGCACSGRDRPPSVILICSLHAERVISWSQTTCGIRAFIFRCFTQDCEHHTGHALKQHSTVIYRSSLVFNEECNLWGMKQEEWKRLDVVRPDWFDCNYDKQPNTSSAPSYLIWLILTAEACFNTEPQATATVKHVNEGPAWLPHTVYLTSCWECHLLTVHEAFWIEMIL